MISSNISRFIFLLVGALCLVSAVDRNNFRTCEQTSFCKRCRRVEPGKSPYILQLDTLNIAPTNVSAELLNTANGVKFRLELFGLMRGTFRLKINEWNPLKPRHEPQFVLDGEPSPKEIVVTERSAEKVVVTCSDKRAELFANPFRIDLYNGPRLTISVNARGLMRFEHLRPKPPPKPESSEGEEQPADAASNTIDDTSDDPAAWEENYKSHHDSKPNGPSAVALDFSFPGAEEAYGLPEHADSLALRDTKDTDPYRLYNLDVFEYELDNGMALYGAIPLLYAHGEKTTSGIFWLNTAETWIDIAKPNRDNVVSSFVNFVSGSSKEDPRVDSHFMSESGIIDVFFFMRSDPLKVIQDYMDLTGHAPLPPFFALGYHQCRWNYNDQDDVRNVAQGFDDHDIPMDVMWLDIEHTDGKRYFTWDPIKFSNPTEMINNLTAKGRKLVTIVDPHIKRDGGYFLHQDAEANGYYIKNKDGNDYEGWCWPGSVSYLDLFNPTVREYYAQRYLLENYHGSTLDLHIWNDMNEPSVFNGPEVTMPKDNVHYGGWEHRDVHNQYGFMHVMATYEGLLRRSKHKYRPFILTRSFFAGSQRYSAVWTGDNLADWNHLRISLPMCLSLSISGISFCGADVGGFFKNPDAELFTRWYQAGAFLPFFRAHSIIESKRREPWLFDEQTTKLVREAIRKRYSYLPLWYTAFGDQAFYGNPVIYPLYALYPEDKETYTIDDQFIVFHKDLLVHPVVTPNAAEVTVYFPGKDDIWYDVDTFEVYSGGQKVRIPVDLAKIPVFQRGGAIVPKFERVRRSATLMNGDPYTFVIALDKNGTAGGRLLIDDGETFDYRTKTKYSYPIILVENNRIKSTNIVPKGTRYETKAWVERVVVLGLKRKAKPVLETKSNGKQTLSASYDKERDALVIRKPGVSVIEDWTITLE